MAELRTDNVFGEAVESKKYSLSQLRVAVSSEDDWNSIIRLRSGEQTLVKMNVGGSALVLQLPHVGPHASNFWFKVTPVDPDQPGKTIKADDVFGEAVDRLISELIGDPQPKSRTYSIGNLSSIVAKKICTASGI